MALFENYEGRMPQLQPVLDKYGFKSFEDVKAYTNGKGVDAYSIVESTQPICFENVKWAYELGAAIAMKENAKTAAEAARWIGVGLQAFLQLLLHFGQCVTAAYFLGKRIVQLVGGADPDLLNLALKFGFLAG